MNYNIAGYMIYLPITFYITIVVGKTCYHNGEIYLLRIINDEPQAVRAINKLLLAGYYLLNLGYATLMLSFWQRINTMRDLTETLCSKLGMIILLLGVLHVNNMLLTYFISKVINKKHQHLNHQLS